MLDVSHRITNSFWSVDQKFLGYDVRLHLMVLVIQNFTIKLKMSELSTICRLFPFYVNASDENPDIVISLQKVYVNREFV